MMKVSIISITKSNVSTVWNPKNETRLHDAKEVGKWMTNNLFWLMSRKNTNCTSKWADLRKMTYTASSKLKCQMSVVSWRKLFLQKLFIMGNGARRPKVAGVLYESHFSTSLHEEYGLKSMRLSQRRSNWN